MRCVLGALGGKVCTEYVGRVGTGGGRVGAGVTEGGKGGRDFAVSSLCQ